MNETILENLNDFKKLTNHPKQIYYRGNTELLSRPKISIVGSRKPTSYTKDMTHRLAYELSKRGICIVSGGAMGVDAISHSSAGASNTISVCHIQQQA